MEPILDMDYFRHAAPTVVRNQYFEMVASEADVVLRTLQELSPSGSEAVEWCLESDQFFEKLQEFNSELNLQKTLFLSVDWSPNTFLLSLTLKRTSSWKTTLIPWPVVREICQPLREIFGDASVLKIIATGSAQKILESEISVIEASCLLRKLLAINTYDYQQCNVAVEAPHPDDVILRKIFNCYIGEAKASGISATIDRMVIPLTHNDINQNQTFVLYCKNGLPVVVFAHAILTIHAYLLGPSLTSEDKDNPLLATAEYINNMGVLRTAWIPIEGTSAGDPGMINKLSENLSFYTSQGILLHRVGIKGPILEDEDKLAPTPLLINMDVELQALDRKKVRSLLKRTDGKSVPSSTPPALETIDEWDGVDPFGEWEGENNPNPNIKPPSGFDFSILDEPPIGKPEIKKPTCYGITR